MNASSREAISRFSLSRLIVPTRVRSRNRRLLLDRRLFPGVDPRTDRRRSSVASRPTDSLRTVARHPSIASRPQPPRARRKNYFTLVFNHLPRLRAVATLSWHGARTIDHRADAQTSIQLNILTHTFWRTEMKIENLSKEL